MKLFLSVKVTWMKIVFFDILAEKKRARDREKERQHKCKSARQTAYIVY